MRPDRRRKLEATIRGVRVFRIDGRRRAVTARNMAHAGWPQWRIRAALGVAAAAVQRALAGQDCGLWSRAMQAEMAVLAREFAP